MRVTARFHRRRTRLRRAARWLSLTGVVAVLAVVGMPATAPAAPRGPSAPAVAESGADVAAQLYGQNCASCHGNQGQGTDRGPSLVGVGTASVDFQLTTGRMPLGNPQYPPWSHAPSFSAAEIDALVSYVATFGPGGPSIPDVRPGDLGTGRALYLVNCAACHSSSGAGGTLTTGQNAPSLYNAAPTQVAEAIRVGPGRMPAFPGDVLQQSEVNAITSYVGVLQDDRGGLAGGDHDNINLDRGGWAIGRIGPFAEGLLSWGAGLGVLVLVVWVLGSRKQ